jgi:hypothetical protein
MELSPPLTILSWDIGTKNLSYCALQQGPIAGSEDDSIYTKHGFFIKDWSLINLYPEEVEILYDCSGKYKSGKNCTKKAKLYIEENEEKKYYCKLHCPKNVVSHSTKVKRSKAAKNKSHRPFEIARRIWDKLNERVDLQDVDYVLVENQPSQLNPVMKSVQMILFSFFSFLAASGNGRIKEVFNVSAKQKEKLPTKDGDWPGSPYELNAIERCRNIKNRYRRRKITCLEYAKLCVETAPEYLNFLVNHSKQDDLADCFLQGCDWLLRNH